MASMREIRLLIKFLNEQLEKIRLQTLPGYFETRVCNVLHCQPC